MRPTWPSCCRSWSRRSTDSFDPGVVTDVFGDGKTLKRQYGFSEYPSLVFVRSGEYVGTITRIQDWGDYLDKISDLFVVAPKRPPGFSIPVVTA